MKTFKTMSDYTDDDFKETMRSAIKLELILCLVAIPALWWKLGWGSAALLAVGALISGSGLWEWLRLMSAVMVRMDAGGETKPMALILIGFFLRLGLAVVLLYVSLKLLNGSVFALAAGLGLGVFCLTIQAIRLMKAWTV
ncbi:hypothetical protein [Granulicella rosea]|uniref:hypothetical protein n=1 Tax=Granulicella rosea TaxID=474952 RepID=UPI001FE2EEE6|nr:hypothetical protein [Granulicella rosea]